MVNVVSKKKVRVKRFVSFLGIFMILMCVCSMFSLSVSAVDSTQAYINLTKSVHTALQGKNYKAEGGGTVSGGDILKGSETAGYDIDESAFNKLTSEAQSDFIRDLDEAAKAAEGTNGVSTDTRQNWYKDLQSKKGVGSKFMNLILEDTKPDFVTANQIYQPFAGVVGTIMGVIAVVGMGLLGIVLVADIFYIALPPVRMLVSDEGDSKGAKKAVSKIFSNDAIYAVKVAEEGDSSDGNKKQALGIYLKRRIFMLILLGICLLYLVQGQIYVFVGWILDLVSGFLGF